MEQVLYFDSSREAYEADAAVLACPDARFELVLRKLLRRLGLEHPDVFRIVGGPKALSSGSDAEQSFVIDQLRASRRLHRTHRLLLVAHSDCGAYGGLCARFDGNRHRERGFHEVELSRAATAVSASLGDWQIDQCFIDFERVLYRPAEPCRRARHQNDLTASSRERDDL